MTTVNELVTTTAERKAGRLIFERDEEKRLRKELALCLDQQRNLIKELAEYSEFLAGRTPGPDWCAHLGIVKVDGQYSISPEPPENLPLSYP